MPYARHTTFSSPSPNSKLYNCLFQGIINSKSGNVLPTSYLKAKFDIGQDTGKKLDSDVVAKGMRRALGIKELITKELIDGSKAQLFYSKLTCTRKSRNEFKLATNMFAIGRVSKRQIPVNVCTSLSMCLGTYPRTQHVSFSQD